jgi:hypothetical protein
VQVVLLMDHKLLNKDNGQLVEVVDMLLLGVCLIILDCIIKYQCSWIKYTGGGVGVPSGAGATATQQDYS